MRLSICVSLAWELVDVKTLLQATVLMSYALDNSSSTLRRSGASEFIRKATIRDEPSLVASIHKHMSMTFTISRMNRGVPPSSPVSGFHSPEAISSRSPIAALPWRSTRATTFIPLWSGLDSLNNRAAVYTAFETRRRSVVTPWSPGPSDFTSQSPSR